MSVLPCVVAGRPMPATCGRRLAPTSTSLRPVGVCKPIRPNASIPRCGWLRQVAAVSARMRTVIPVGDDGGGLSPPLEQQAPHGAHGGKHKAHGLLVIALTDDKGRLVWVSEARPGRTSEIIACRHDQLTRKLRAVGLGAIADLGFIGLDDSDPDADPVVITGYRAARNRLLTRGQKLSNKAWAAVRAPVKQGFAHLKN
ncbi:transposase family protein [Streptomyces sp. NPDC048404]|uniref:transposase family protein n=1 Tax=unclassified Streptomyces TaxID=2593676 RepID=UPI00342837E5